MNTYLWLITAKTNLHAGNENSANYGVIDKSVQRDAVTELPCINSSSLKGAINEYCAHNCKGQLDLLSIFGSDKTNSQAESKKGGAIFFDAKILYLPVQDDNNLFSYVFCKPIIDELQSRLALFGKKLADTNSLASVLVQNHDISPISPKEFAEKCDNENLPIIARNELKNGTSKNLWYEQVVPAETVFYTLIQEEGESLKNALDGKVIQIGANATIGYGYCKFKCIEIENL